MSQFDFVAGHPALDFVNTVANRLHPTKSRELLEEPGDLALWLTDAGLEAAEFSKDDLSRARELREHLHRAFVAFADGELPAEATLAQIDRLRREFEKDRRLVVADRAVALGWSDTARPLERALSPVLLSGIDLLTSDQSARIRQCEGPGCGWLFLDRSRGNSKRRWCSMQDCGNRAKATRHHARARTETPA